jgi:hypothetical protein
MLMFGCVLKAFFFALNGLQNLFFYVCNSQHIYQCAFGQVVDYYSRLLHHQ